MSPPSDDGARSAPARAASVLGRGAIALLLVIGCAQIFGIDEACVIGDEGCVEPDSGSGLCTPGDRGCTTLDGGIEGLCAQYCAQLDTRCTRSPQYDAERPECLSLCRYFPRAQGESIAGNTLECRMERADSSSGERSDCFAAGRGGENVCGSNCDAYCSLMQSLCPLRFGEFDPSMSLADDAVACQAECALLVDRRDFDPALGSEDEFDDRGEFMVAPTVQCRLWHLGSAAIEADQFGTLDNSHCDHAVGVSDCLPVSLD